VWADDEPTHAGLAVAARDDCGPRDRNAGAWQWSHVCGHGGAGRPMTAGRDGNAASLGRKKKEKTENDKIGSTCQVAHPIF